MLALAMQSGGRSRHTVPGLHLSGVSETGSSGTLEQGGTAALPAGKSCSRSSR